MTELSVRERILHRLLTDEVVTQEQLDQCIREEAESSLTFDRLLMEKGFASEEKLLRIIAEETHTPYMSQVPSVETPVEFTSAIPVELARAYSLVALQRDNGSMRVATSRPLDVHLLDEIATLMRTPVEPVAMPSRMVANIINLAYEQNYVQMEDVAGHLEQEDIEGITKDFEETEDLLDMANKAPIIKLVNSLLFQALKMRASDIHIQPYEDRVQVRFRIDGMLYDTLTITKKIQDAVISRVKIMGRMDIAERRLPQDGGTSIRIGGKEVDLRISSVPTTHGERIVFRLQDKSSGIYVLDKIGLGEGHGNIVSDLIQYSHGIILVTGPTGSGKTTTLYAVLSKINSSDKNIITIEEPIEYLLPGISQIQVSNKKGLTFAAGLRSIVRQDPDVIMVGEIRDLETARIAIQSSLTGHLVFSTLHTNDSAGAITRLLDIGVEPYLVASSVIAVVAQRLVRVICQTCKEPLDPEPGLLEQLDLSVADLLEGKVWKGTGCDDCLHTGYRGRTGIYEMLVIDDEVKHQITERASATQIKKLAVSKNLVTLRRDGANKVAQGITTLDEVFRVTQREGF